MLDRTLARYGPAYILWMMMVTRLFGCAGGILVFYYVQLTMGHDPALLHHFRVAALVTVVIALVITTIQGLIESRSLRALIEHFREGKIVPERLISVGTRQVLVFPFNHNVRAAVIVHICCVGGCCLYLHWRASAPAIMLVHVTIAGFMGIVVALSLTYLLMAHMLQPVVRYFVRENISINYDTVPQGKLQNRLLFSTILVTLITALMIATVANQKAADIIARPAKQAELVRDLHVHTTVISAIAVLVSIALALILARSMGRRMRDIVHGMRLVEQGDLGYQIEAYGADEIGVLARSFNQMVRQLGQKHEIIQELNTNLERKVKARTQELQNSYEQLKEYDRLKTEFFTNVSHEVRTPLTLILAPVENVLEAGGNLIESQRQSLEIVRRNTLQLLSLINDMLDFAKLETSQMTLQRSELSINTLMYDASISAEGLAGQRGITLRLDLSEDVPEIHGDRDRILKVIMNLVSNALKFTEPGGEITLRSLSDSSVVRIEVRDTGIGIEPEHLSRVFDRFMQIDGSLSRKYAGTGLGLALAKEIVDLHGGEIGVTSVKNEGSCFYFTLPIKVDPDSTSVPVEESSSEHVSIQSLSEFEPILNAPEVRSVPMDARTVLVIDDSPELLSVFEMLLGDTYRLLTAKDGEEGWTQILKQHPDLIISDVMMPNLNGYELCRRAKSDPRTQRIPFVLLTAKTDLSLRIDGLTQGADDYLTKPFNASELRARVASLIRLRSMDDELVKRNNELESLVSDLKNTQEKLVHSEKMTSLGRLVSGLAHEINNSVNAIYNGIRPLHEEVRLLLNEVDVHEPSEEGGILGRSIPQASMADSAATILELADLVEAEAKNVAGVVADLKRFSHPGQAEFVPYKLRDAIDVPLGLLAQKLAGRITVHKDYKNTEKIMCVPSDLGRVFLNLLDNAQQAIEGAGEIFIRVDQDENAVFTEIRDTGMGIPPDVASKIFEPFFTTKQIGVGTGLGLSISYGIIKQHGGTIEVSSSRGQGSTFAVRLPRASVHTPDGLKPVSAR